MKQFVGSLLILLFMSIEAYGAFSHGYRMGVITENGTEGILFKNGEAALMMGRQSVKKLVEDKSKLIQKPDGTTGYKTTLVNPWKFSFNTKYSEDMQKLAGKEVIVEYIE